jgi:hypothetical protein
MKLLLKLKNYLNPSIALQDQVSKQGHSGDWGFTPMELMISDQHTISSQLEHSPQRTREIQ